MRSVTPVLLITGAPASGKSTLGRRLAHDLGLPFLSKDLFKESLFDTLGCEDRAWSQRLGYACTMLLYRTAEALLAAGQPVALESNFYAKWDVPEFEKLRQRYGCRFIQVLCSADLEVLTTRFEQRAVSGERHPGHRDHLHVAEWRARLINEPWEALPLGGPVIVVDTSDSDSFDYDDVLRKLTALLG